MKIKQRPEDFSVRESFRFDPVDDGRFRVYLMDKQKLSTFDAVERIRERFGLRPGLISYCGLKDKQGRTEQLIAVDGANVEMQDRDLRLKYMGRTDRALSAANTTSNRFSVTVRALEPEDLKKLNTSAAEVARLGVVNYFDSQRFGSLKHGQGFIAKDLLRGDFEAALRNYMAKPSTLDRTEDAKVKRFWKENWRHWDARCPYPGNKKYYRILKVLNSRPNDFEEAFLQIDSSYRALLIFEYQSYLWNEGVRRLLQLLFPREHLFPMPYQAGTLLFHKDADPKVLRSLRNLTFPLLAPDTPIDDEEPKVQEAVKWILGKEKTSLEALRIPGAKKRLFFKHEDRPVLIHPEKLVLGRPNRDELNPGFTKLNVAFTLPPGSYATLVVKRLFHFTYREESAEEIAASARESYARTAAREAEEAGLEPAALEAAETGALGLSTSADEAGAARRGKPASSVRGKPVPASRGSSVTPERGEPTAVPRAKKAEPAKAAKELGFRAQQKARKAAREVSRAVTAKHLESRKKKRR